MKPGRRGGLVYSTELGRTCPTCRRPLAACACPAEPEVPRGDGIVRVARETKGRKGAGVTVITGLGLSGPPLAELATALKKRCGSGGTVKDGRVEIQGDHRDLLVTELGKRGFTVKRVGG
ncbi:MAG: translation initiation factor Sui1 [Gemmatimonadetes bacterium]|nr:translation initiation factor Sui1 [Gemmatimonadota bacterium]MCA9762243.1 translation initiation factor Sui1 [Gemmatimonadota bacterium]MCA9767964.1 translation initiation factor Sui1 [Gemmatimonadota bacterium]HPF60972.1 translation initiation factor Sui1 [Gemmatimonadales bacterium]HRX17764.1 translation initiation factor Sui1 [Gemmatimonadales bacterium]